MKFVIVLACFMVAAVVCSAEEEPIEKPDYSVCEPGENIVACKRNPCDVEQECHGYPDATCQNDFCGGCYAHWFVGDEEVTCEGEAPDTGAEMLD